MRAGGMFRGIGRGGTRFVKARDGDVQIEMVMSEPRGRRALAASARGDHHRNPHHRAR